MTLAELARSTPEKSTLTAYDDSFEQPEPTYPNGTHLIEVEIDPETGVTIIVGYWIVDVEGEARAIEIASRIVAYVKAPIEVRQVMDAPPDF